MKIAILGTSNSILKNGYAPLYQALEFPNQVDNYSIGATICQFIPFALEKYAIFKNYDFLITDCCPNDSDCFYCKQRTADWFYNELFTILSTIKEARIKHLHLIFPYKNSQVLQKMHVQVCKELSIPYLDIGSIITNATPRSEREPMQDIHHVSPFFSKQFAYVIKEKRKEISKNPVQTSGKTHIAKKYIYYDLTKNLQQKYPVITRATSHLTENFIHIQNKQEILLDKLPALNLEGLYFYSNKEAGLFNLSSANSVCNYSLYFPTADYIFYQPIPQNTFPVRSFLKIQSGFNKKSPYVMMENNAEPERKNYSEILLNSLLFSKETDTPLEWKEKKYSQNIQNDAQRFEKIYFFIVSLKKNTALENSIPEEFIVIAANLFPNNAHIRKSFTRLLKRTENPYYFYWFVQQYLLPRKKYASAIKLLEKALQIKNDTLFTETLTVCAIKKEFFAKAHTLIKSIDRNRNFTAIKLECMLAAAMRNKELFLLNARKLLNCNTQFHYLLFLAASCIELNEYQQAAELLNTALADRRNFRQDNKTENMRKINELIRKIQEKTQ